MHRGHTDNCVKFIFHLFQNQFLHLQELIKTYYSIDCAHMLNVYKIVKNII